MNTEYFIMHIWVLGIATFLAGCATIGFIIAFIYEEYRKIWLFSAIVSLLFFSSGLTWWIISGNQPWRPEYNSLHEIKDVVFPDGSKVQMFTCDNVHHNVTSMFGKVVDEKEWVIRRVRWSPLYSGLSWSGSERCNGDHFFIEHKRGEKPSVELVEKSKNLSGTSDK